jgi:hypothetical protein
MYMVKLSLCLTNLALHHEGVALAAGEWSASRPGRFNPGERAPGTHWIGGWVDLRVGLDDEEKKNS